MPYRLVKRRMLQIPRLDSSLIRSWFIRLFQNITVSSPSSHLRTGDAVAKILERYLVVKVSDRFVRNSFQVIGLRFVDENPKPKRSTKSITVRIGSAKTTDVRPWIDRSIS